MPPADAQQLAVTVAFDAADGVWFVVESDLPGLCVETRTLDEMRDAIDDLAPDLVEANLPEHQRNWPLRLQHVLETKRRAA